MERPLTMTYKTLAIGFLTMAALGGLAACDGAATDTLKPQAAAEDPAAALKAAQSFRTIKPGAAVSITHAFQGEPEAGVSGAVDLTILENYGPGLLELTATGTDGLTVFEPTARKSVSMGSSERHMWTIGFEPEAEGEHFLNITAVAQPDGLPVESRAFAIRVQVGETAPRQSKAVLDATGDAVVVMDAQEEIISGE